MSINLTFNDGQWKHSNKMHYITYNNIDFIYEIETNTWKTLYGDFTGNSVLEIYNAIKQNIKTKVIAVYFPIEVGALNLESKEVAIVGGKGCEYLLDNGNLVLKDSTYLLLTNTPQTKQLLAEIDKNIKEGVKTRRKVWEKSEKAQVRQLKALKKKLLKLAYK